MAGVFQIYNNGMNPPAPSSIVMMPGAPRLRLITGLSQTGALAMSVRIALGVGFGLAMIAAGTAKAATDVCDALGLSGLTISSDDNCLVITGSVEKDFNWDDYKKCFPNAPSCDQPVRLNDAIAFSNFRVGVDPRYIMTWDAPYGLLETGPAPVHTPAVDVPVRYSGYGLGLGIQTQLDISHFRPIDLDLELDYSKITGSGSRTNVSLPNGVGVPSVGLIDGVFSSGATTIPSMTIDTDRSTFGLDKNAKIPLFGFRGSMGSIGYNDMLYAMVGERIGFTGETQKVNIASGAATYDTSLQGGYFGLYGGIGMDKTIDLPNTDMYFGANLSLSAGMDMHRYRVTDTVAGTAVTTSTNTYDVSGTVPTVKLGTDFYLAGSDKFYFGAGGSISSGLVPQFVIQRPVSNVHTTPTLGLVAPFADEAHINLLFRF